jgi:CopG-like RHH_1 or ribbon-helix-helix domain, RHH_5
MVNSRRVNAVPAKIPRIAVYLSEDVKADLESLANAERRSVSQMAAMLIEEAIARAKAEDRLKPPPQNEDSTTR